MPETSVAKLGWLLLLAVPAVAPASDVPKGWHEFASARGGYVAYYPDSWHVLEPGLATLYICSFPVSQAVRAVIVPENGATISIASPPVGTRDIEHWVASDTAAHRVRSRKQVTLQRSEPNPPLRVTEVIFESIEGPDTTSWYFAISGHILVANLSYWRGDPNEAKYRRVLRGMLAIIAPLGR
jgi:hypothetical protein